MSGYFPIDRDILTSSLWATGSPTQIKVFFYLLLSAKHGGVIKDSLPGIALRCGLGVDQVREAVEWLESPDPDSRTTDEGGARLKRIEDGWVLVNYEKHRSKDYSTPRVQRWRDRKKGEPLQGVTATPKTVTETNNNNNNHNNDLYEERETSVSPYIEPPPEEERHPEIVRDERALLVWRSVLKLLEETVPEHNYATWLRPTRAVGFQRVPPGDDNWALVVEVPNEEFRAHIWETYGSRIRSAMKRASPGAPDLLIVVGAFKPL